MKCPNCNETLLITERQSVEIDYCPNCRGVWLDRGELDKLLDVAASQNSSAAPRYTERQDKHYDTRGDRYPQHPHKYPHKKKSFLSDFFDFD